MSWSVNATGHTADADAEKRLVDKLRDVLADDAAGAGNATFSGQHSGCVNLLADTAPAPSADQ